MLAAAPFAPLTRPKSSTAAELVPAFTTVGVDPGASAVTLPTAMLAAAPAAPLAPVAPVSPVTSPQSRIAFVEEPTFTTVGVDPGGS